MGVVGATMTKRRNRELNGHSGEKERKNGNREFEGEAW